MDEPKLSELLTRYDIKPIPCWSEIGYGWLPLVEQLIKDLIALGWDRDLRQCKEKFGGLRFYIGAGSPEVYDRIDRAERESQKTCEDCGQPGETNKTGWWRTLCEEHVLST